MELVAPFGGHDEILKDLSVNLFGGRPFKFHAVGSDGQRRVQSYENAPSDAPAS
jgi:cytolysin-activating lysine-acyltransferase